MMKCFALALLVAVAMATGSQAKVSYAGHSVVRVEYTPELQEWVRKAVTDLGLDIWADHKGVMDVLLGPDYTHTFLNKFNQRGAKAAVMIKDVQELIDAEETALKSHSKSTRAVDSTTYRNFEELQAELDGLEADFPSLVSSYVVTNTYEGRPLRVAKVSSDIGDTRPAVWIDCGIHAREWVSQATCMYFLDQLTSLYGSDAGITALVDMYDFHILPVTNPDGYAFTWSSDRLWRKNRVPYGNCFGADPNRNFDSNFGGEGASDLPCGDTYHGPEAFSEQESKGVKQATEDLGARLAGFFTVHSYSQYWMTPYGYKSDIPADYPEMMRVSTIGADALTAVHGTQYTVGNIADVIYIASGGSTDWSYDALGMPFSFALELRDRGFYGFQLPEEQIIPTGEETFAGVVAAINAFDSGK